MKDYNGKWLQYSVYLGALNQQQINHMLKKLQKLAQQERTSIIIIPIPKNTPPWIECTTNQQNKANEALQTAKKHGIKIITIKPKNQQTKTTKHQRKKTNQHTEK